MGRKMLDVLEWGKKRKWQFLFFRALFMKPGFSPDSLQVRFLLIVWKYIGGFVGDTIKPLSRYAFTIESRGKHGAKLYIVQSHTLHWDSVCYLCEAR